MPAVGTVNFYILLYFCLNSAHFETFHSQVEGLLDWLQPEGPIAYFFYKRGI